MNTTDTQPPHASRPSETAYLPSQQQRDFWLLQKLATDPAAYNLCCTVTLDTPVSHDCLRSAISSVVSTETQLRAAFLESFNGDLSVMVSDHANVPLREMTGENLEVAIRSFATEPFQLDRAPLLRIGLVNLGSSRTMIVLVSHHLALDGNGAQRLLLNLVHSALGGPIDSSANTIGPRDYPAYVAAESRRSNMHSRADHQFWRDKISGSNSSGDPQIAGEPGQVGGASSVSIPLPPSLRSTIRHVSRTARVSPFMVLLAAVGRVAGSANPTPGGRFICGVPVDRRGEAVAVGTYTTMLPAVLSLASIDDPETLLADARVATLDALTHPYVTLHDLMRLTHRDQGSESPTSVLPWQLILNWVRSSGRSSVADARIDPPRAISTGTKSSIAVTVYDHSKDASECILSWNPEIYNEGQIRSWWRTVIHELSELCVTVSINGSPQSNPTPVEYYNVYEDSIDNLLPERNSFTSSDLETRLAVLMSEALGLPVKDFDVDTSFFNAGGDSVSASRFLAAVRKQFDMNIRMIDFFDNPTIAFLASGLHGTR